MKRSDEKVLWSAVVAGESPRLAGCRLGLHPKRVRYLCEKWADRGVYEYGTSCDLGWLTREGASNQDAV